MTQNPWRYPGGKGRMSKAILPMIPNDVVGYCEPFVGGGGVLIPLLDHTPAGLTITLNDADPRVAAWWGIVSGPDMESFLGLLAMLRDVVPTVEMHKQIQEWGLSPVNISLVQAFAGMFLNRCSYSGILDAGPIGGQSQASDYKVGCRFNAPVLRRNHQDVRLLLSQHAVSVSSCDFREAVKSLSTDVFIYADPPYRKMGHRMYPVEFTVSDHEDLAVILHCRDRWLLSYDDHPWVRERYRDCHIEQASTWYTAAGSRQTKGELLIRPDVTA